MGLHTVLWGTMEPQGRPLTPGTSYGTPPFDSAQDSATPTFLNCTLQVRRHGMWRHHCRFHKLTVKMFELVFVFFFSPLHLQSSCSPNASDGLMSAKGSLETRGTQPSAEPERSAQKRLRSSAFPSSLSWDSDSEREALDGNTRLHTYCKNLLHTFEEKHAQ